MGNIIHKWASRIGRIEWKISRCLLFLLYLNPIFLSAQNYPTRHFTMRDGLPGMAIQCIYKDSRGLMWIGTRSGLCSFDGKSFRIFKTSDGMTANQVWAIAEDEQGNLWFGSYGDGLYKYDGKHFDRFTKRDGLVDDHVRVLCWSKNFHCLIAGCEGGISTLKGEKFINSPEETFSKKNGSAVTGLADAGKFIYITTYGPNNPLRFYPDKNIFVSVNDPKLHYPANSFSVFIDSKGDSIFSYDHSGVRIYRKEEIVQNESMGQVFGISEDKRGDLWFASWSYINRQMKEGVFRYDGKTFRNYKDAFGITDKEIWTVFYDPEQDILWVGTLTEGLFKVPFSSITGYPAAYFGLEKLKMKDAFVDSKNDLWVSGDRELIRIKPEEGYSFMNKTPMILSYRKFWNGRDQANYYPLEPDLKAALNLNPARFSDFTKNTLFDFQKVIEGNDHSIYFTNKFGLFNYFPERGQTEFLGPDGNLGDFDVVGKDTLLITKWGATELLPDFRKNQSNLFGTSFFAFKKDGEPKNVNRLVKNNKSYWYASSTSGLWMSQGTKLIHFNESDSTISNNLNDICFDEKSHIIFGSNTGEICVATYTDKKLKIDYRINSSNGLQGNSISWLVADRNGKLWVGTNLGLNCINLTELDKNGNPAIRFLDEEDGYTGQSSKKAVVDAQGNLWIGADGQLIRLDTKSYLSSELQSGKIILKSLEINNTPADSIQKMEPDRWSSYPSGKIRLNSYENDLVFYFDILNYNNPGKDQFRYKLSGYDKTWNMWSNSRKAIYTNLSPGRYSFCVESYNLQTLTKAQPLRIDFTIRHPWWRLWYLQALAFVLLLAAVVGFTRKFTKAEKEKQLKKLEIEKKIAQLEMNALQAQMNPHFIFNCMNSIQYYVLANRMDEALVYLSDFSKVLRELLVNATLQQVLLKQETDFLNSYLRLEQMRFPDKFDYTIQGLDGENDCKVLIPPMLVQPFAENAIRHGFMNLTKKGQLSVVFEKVENDVIKCTITDNGVGRENARLQKGANTENDRPHSAAITETRLRLFNTIGSPDKYRIVYTDLTKNRKPGGLKVELFVPMEMGNG